MKSILFLCIANSARSQMAEGIARRVLGPHVRVQSAGSVPTSVNPMAVKAMAEVGIDIRGQKSKSIAEIDLSGVDTVITLCADEVCPVLPKAVQHVHWPLPDPAERDRPHNEQILLFREVRDELGKRIRELLVPK